MFGNWYFFPFGLLFLVNLGLLFIYLTNLKIMGLFVPLLGTPILWMRSISPGEISKSISLFTLFTTTSLVSSFWFSFAPRMKIQFLLEYCSCLSTRDNRYSEKTFWIAKTFHLSLADDFTYHFQYLDNNKCISIIFNFMSGYQNIHPTWFLFL